MTDVRTAVTTVPAFTLGDRLRRARANARLEQDELAARMRVGRTTVVRYENDASEKVKVRTLLDWAEATGVPFWWIEQGLEPEPAGAAGVTRCARRDSNPQPSDPWSRGTNVTSLAVHREAARTAKLEQVSQVRRVRGPEIKAA